MDARFPFPLALFAALVGAPAQAQVIEGTARVIDGDTIDMTGTRVRLAHMDAPEARQTCVRDDQEWACGATATQELAAILDRQPVACTIIATDVYRRKVATCRTRVFDIGREMVRRGMAVASDDAPLAYGEAAVIAKRMQSGLWSSSFELPREWRQKNPRQDRQAAAASQPTRQAPMPRVERVFRNEFGCTIKGNRSRRGDWIYHLPGRPYYDVTRAEEMFCTESEARAAGYRKSRA